MMLPVFKIHLVISIFLFSILTQASNFSQFFPSVSGGASSGSIDSQMRSDFQFFKHLDSSSRNNSNRC